MTATRGAPASRVRPLRNLRHLYEEARGEGGGPSAETVITVAVVAAAVLFTLFQLQPGLLAANTTPAGGDTGAHVWGPDYMRRELLPDFRITGWAPDWYAGFPAYHFYFPLPSLLIVLLDVILPYGIAFKLVTVLGLLSLPVAAWAFGRLAGMRFPGPAVLAVATVPFLFDRGFTIYGGNIASTLAGEFTFSIALSLALLFLGVVARGLDTGRHRALAGVLLAATGLCHLLPTVFAVVGAAVLLGLRPGRRGLKFLAAVFAVGALLAAFWTVPFLMRLPYANDMGWEKITEYAEHLIPQDLRWVVALAAAGAAAAVAFRRRVGVFLMVMVALSAVLFVVAPQGRLWNARVLPFYYLSLYLLAGVAVAELGQALGRMFAVDPDDPKPLAARATPIVAALCVWMVVGLPLKVLPGWLPKPESADSSFIPGWARWNYSGYERKPAYPEYKGIIDTMAEVGRTNGCGRANWEYESGLDRFGTPMALMLLPYWTDGCIGSMEGLYFESSATVPFHFLSAAELSKAPSNPQRDLPYDSLDVAAGVRHLQLLGARYYLAFSPEAVSQAEAHPDLTLLATTGRWRVYEVGGSELVTPLRNQPAVLKGVDKGRHGWLDVAVDWYMEPARHDVFLAASGPAAWPRVEVRTQRTTSEVAGASVEVDQPPRRPVDQVRVSNIRSSDDSISFDVDRPGSPVLVKASYFPNWKAKGAEGPWRVAPNLMVVVPTSSRVSLHYGWTPVDVLGWVLTLAGAALAVTFARRGPAPVDEQGGGRGLVSSETPPPSGPVDGVEDPAPVGVRRGS
jgi:hypothetical protein